MSAVALPTKFKISRRSGGFAHAQHTGVSGTFRCGRENSILLVGLGKPNAAMHQHGRGERRIACAIGFCKRVSYTSEPRLGPHLALVIWRRESAVCNPVRSARVSDQSGEVCCIDKIPTAAGANLYCVSNSRPSKSPVCPASYQFAHGAAKVQSTTSWPLHCSKASQRTPVLPTRAASNLGRRTRQERDKSARRLHPV